MRKSYRFLAAWLMACLFTTTAYSQTVTVSGTIKDESTKESVASATVQVKGTDRTTYTNSNGEFSIKVSRLPVVLVVTSIGYEAQEITVTDASKPVSVNFKVSVRMDEGVFVSSAARLPQRILEAPVTVERYSSRDLRNVAAPNYYEALGNLKGVDVHTASLTFRTITTRGFVSSGNLRLNQLVDGMDNQAPGLNFAVGSVIGPSDLDVDNVEILSGASSALYGSGGMNGTVLITTKDPFKYQDLSYNIKMGIMHVDGKQRNASPYYDWAFRYAKSFRNRLAFKVALQLIKGNDWEAEDYRNKAQVGILSKVVGGNRQSDPGYNGVNVYGDETSADMAGFSFFVQDQTRRSLLSASGGSIDVVSLLNSYYGAIGNPIYPTDAQRNGFYTFAGFPAPVLAFLNNPAVKPNIDNMFPFYNGFKNNYFNKAVISRTGYNEENLVDYNTINVKATAAVHYRINDRLELSVATYFGTGTTVYTGADRYSLRNLKMAQHKFEAKHKNWFIRAYTTQENAGDSYNATALGAFLNETYRPSSVWFPTYIATFSEGRRLNQAAVSDATLHANARASVDIGRYIPGTKAFDSVSAILKKTPIRKGGALFLDKSDLYATEGQLHLSEAFGFSKLVDVLVGASWKQWVMNSQGTIFADTASKIRVNEYGTYIQLKKGFIHDAKGEDRFTIIASGRYDKQTNFDGRFTPRVTGVVKLFKDNFLRLSYQSAYRFPSNQNQYISLVTGSGVLMGSLPEFQTYYKLNTNVGYTAASVLSYRAGTIADSSRLVVATYNNVRPEKVYSSEIGYRGILAKRLMIDAYYYYSRYQDFLINVAVVQPKIGSKYEVYSPYSSTNLSYVQNSQQTVKSDGWGISLDYQFKKNFHIYGNVFSDVLKGVATDEVTYFNAPKYRYNIGLRNENVCHNIGFNVVFKWQDNNYYEGTFVSGTLPYFGWWDAQVTYRPQGTKSVFRVGGTNLGNNYYRTGYGSPAVGGLYYISYGFNLY
jgi:outer membrane receptor protein involved in Fe transport